MLSRRFTRDLILVLIILSVAIAAPVAYFATQARRDISEQFIFDASNRAVERFRGMAQSMEATLGLMRDWGISGQLHLEKDDDLARFLFPVFTREKQLTGISVGTQSGESFSVWRDGNRFRSRHVHMSGGENNAEEKYWTSQAEILEESTATSTYDPRLRPWFTPALTSRKIQWTQPYKFHSTQRVGITASTSFLRKDDGEPVVLAFDMQLDKLFEDFSGLSPSDHSRIIIFRHDNQLYRPGGDSLEPGFMPMVDVEDSLIRKVHANWTGEEDLAGRVVSVLHDGAVWWCGFQPLEKESRNTWICVMIPEKDITGHAGRRMYRVIGVGILSLIIASGLAVWLVYRGHRSFEGAALFDPEHPESSLRQLIEQGENRAVEFKSTLRMNLHSKKPGKEIELAWIKGVAGFLNTDGGVLLLGVTDDGEITGLERDVFENEDKCRLHFKNLISKHIGADRSKYIRFLLVPIDGKTVGVVRCARAEEPVFVKDGNKEHFYIRNGPSSDELPVSQALNYIKRRKR
ncbi:RNA-binding domain-containing protein [Pontiella agarivorans]|uniref:DNA binding domain-containing protein n=1 Tax=Pontiella agarivorans TaxID=3038953 RepID=A0ABU5MXJ7_9BACT|nr:RNA-binding domain-containing protein [Pontiella agarivorans]MDZ8118858.1 putative DNA binding domain-containing protein [Pontiella agarivorans]